MPDTDFHDICDSNAMNLVTVSTSLSVYLSKHGAVISKEVKEIIGECTYLANQYDYDKSIEIDNPPNESVKAAEEILKKLSSVENLLIEKVHSQSINLASSKKFVGEFWFR